MSNEEKIEVAEQRILELKTLIDHWKTSNISSRKATADFVDSILSESQEVQAAWFQDMFSFPSILLFIFIDNLKFYIFNKTK